MDLLTIDGVRRNINHTGAWYPPENPEWPYKCFIGLSGNIQGLQIIE